MSEPKFYSKNYINSDNSYSSPHVGDAGFSSLYDKDRSSQVVTVTAGSDSTEVEFTITFKEGSVAVNRTFTSIWVLNHNMKQWDIEYYDGTWHSLLAQTVDATVDRLVEFAAVTASMLRISCLKTQVAHDQKKIGELIVANLLLDIGKDMSNYDVRYREKVKDIVLGDGSLHRVVSPYGNSYSLSQKYEANVGFKYISKSLRDSLKAIKELNESVLWLPESSALPYEIFEVLWTSPWAEKFSSLYKSSGYDISFTLRGV